MPDFRCTDNIAVTLAPHGWHLVPAELDRRSWRRLYIRVEHDRRVAHLHLMPAGNDRWQEQIDFRDALRANPALIADYADPVAKFGDTPRLVYGLIPSRGR